jgi:hypothetical protein
MLASSGQGFPEERAEQIIEIAKALNTVEAA